MADYKDRSKQDQYREGYNMGSRMTPAQAAGANAAEKDRNKKNQEFVDSMVEASKRNATQAARNTTQSENKTTNTSTGCLVLIVAVAAAGGKLLGLF